MEINKINLRIARQDIADALSFVENKHGIKFSIGSLRFSTNEFSGKITATNVVKKEIGEGSEAAQFKMYARIYGLEDTDLGKQFVFKNKVYKVVGVRPQSPKFPIVCETGGKSFKFPYSTVSTLLGKKKINVVPYSFNNIEGNDVMETDMDVEKQIQDEIRRGII